MFLIYPHMTGVLNILQVLSPDAYNFSIRILSFFNIVDNTLDAYSKWGLTTDL